VIAMVRLPRRRRAASQVTLLPQPDSPTMPSASPGCELEVDAAYDGHEAASSLEGDAEVVQCQQRRRIRLGAG
jgi:hypothetical protein